PKASLPFRYGESRFRAHESGTTRRAENEDSPCRKSGLAVLEMETRRRRNGDSSSWESRLAAVKVSGGGRLGVGHPRREDREACPGAVAGGRRDHGVGVVEPQLGLPALARRPEAHPHRDRRDRRGL